MTLSDDQLAAIRNARGFGVSFRVIARELELPLRVIRAALDPKKQKTKSTGKARVNKSAGHPDSGN